MTRRDLFVLPVLMLATALLCLAVIEGVARLLVPEQLSELCQMSDGLDFKPGCKSTEKAAEGPQVTLQYNECGLRSAQSCLSLPANDYRVAILGSSISRGYAVAYDDMYAPRLEQGLRQAYGQPVDVQDVPINWPKAPDDAAWASIAGQTDAALRLHPKMLLLFVASWDLYKYQDAPSSAPGPTAMIHAGFIRNTAAFRLGSDLMRGLRAMRERSRAVLLLRHLLYRNDRTFVDLYLANGEESDYLRAPMSAAWQQKLGMLEKVVVPIAQAAAQQKVPTVLVLVPFEPQILLARGAVTRAGIDAWAFNRQIAALARRDGLGFIDVLPSFVAAPPGRAYYYRVNGHPAALGHEIIAAALLHCLIAPQATADCVNIPVYKHSAEN